MADFWLLTSAGYTFPHVTDWVRPIVAAADEHFRRAEYAQAQPHYEKLIQQDVRYPDVFNHLGVIYHLSGRLREARWCFEQALELNPGYLEASLNLTVTCNELGEYGSSVRTIQRARRGTEETNDSFRRGKVANTHRTLAQAYIELGRPEDAVHEYGRALRLCPQFHDIRLELVHLLRIRGDLQRAREELALILQLDPNHQDARAMMGVLEMEAGDRELGLKHLRAVVSERADHPVARNLLAQVDPKLQEAS